MTPSSNTLTPTWRTARSRAPLPHWLFLHSLSLSSPPNTHFECCMNLVGAPAPCGPQIPPLATESMCVLPSLVQAPLSSGSFLEVDQGSPRLPGFHWVVGIWSGMRRTYPPPLSAFLFFNRVVSKRKSSAQGRERRRCQELWEPLPKCLSFLGCVLPGKTS